MWTQNANVISTRGIPFGAVSISVCGHIYEVVITTTEVQIGGGTPSKIPSGIKKFVPFESWTPWKKQPKIVKISLYCYGKIFEETVMVDNDTDVTTDNVKIYDTGSEITISVVGIKTY